MQQGSGLVLELPAGDPGGCFPDLFRGDGHPQLLQMIGRAAQQSESVVHAYLAGHVHVLAAIRGVAPAPALTVLAGSGSRAERQDTTEYRIEGADLVVEKLGFVRVDVLAEREPPRLRITLFSTPPSAALAFLGSTAVACYEIELDGSVPHAVGRQNILGTQQPSPRAGFELRRGLPCADLPSPES